jgi:aspartyl protease family protein
LGRVLNFIAVLALALPAIAHATDVTVIGLFPTKVVVQINGGAPRTLAVGQKTAEGVTVVSIERDGATLEVDGRRKPLKMGQHHASGATSDRQTVTLNADSRGHFLVDGQINGGSVRFLLDTGATSIALSAADARRLGVNYQRGQAVRMNTANGIAGGYRITLDTVRIGDIALNGVEAVVMEGNALPVALLGMTFLNRTEMRREGQTMTLTRRF